MGTRNRRGLLVRRLVVVALCSIIAVAINQQQGQALADDTRIYDTLLGYPPRLVRDRADRPRPGGPDRPAHRTGHFGPSGHRWYGPVAGQAICGRRPAG